MYRRRNVKRPPPCPVASQCVVGGRLVALIFCLSRPVQAQGHTDVVVRGSLVPAANRDATVASSVVSGEDLREPGATAADVLGRVPGVQVSRTGSTSDLATAAIRGATSAQTPIYLADVRLNDDILGSADLSTLPLFLIERVEVYRGNAPIDANRLGIGGAVFFQPRLPQRNELRAGATFGSFGERSIFLAAALGRRNAGALVAVGHERADNDYEFRAPDGNARSRANADSSATTAWGIGRYRWPGGARVVTIFHAHNREQGLPGFALVPDERARSDSRRLLGAMSAHIPCSARRDDRSRCTINLVTSGLRTSTSLTDSLLEVIPWPGAWAEGDRIEQGARLNYEATAALSLATAANISREHIYVGATGEVPSDATRYSLRPAVVATVRPTPWTELSGIVAADAHATNSDASDTYLFEPGWRVGIRQDVVAAIQVNANIGHYSRIPTLGELHGVSANIRGNRALVAEQGETVDAGFRFFVPSSSYFRLETSFFAFARRANDLIAYRRTGPSAIAPYNVGRAQILGLEGAVAVEALKHIGAELALSAMDPRDTTEGRSEQNDILPYRSRLVVVGSARIFDDQGLDAIGITQPSLRLRFTHRSSKYSDTAGLIVINDQTPVDIELGFGILKRALFCRFALRNVFDVDEFDAIGLPLPRRNVHASLELEIE